MNLKQRMRVASHNLTWLLGTRFPKSIPLVFVVGYPKSGNTWVAQLVAHCLELPYPRRSLLPVGFAAVVMGHKRVWKSYPRGVYVVRDGRDAIVAQFCFQVSHLPEGDHPRLPSVQRRSFPGLTNKDNARELFDAFVARQLVNPIAAHANWADHVRSYSKVKNPNVALVRYEDLQADGEATLARVISELTGESPDIERAREAMNRFAFRKQAARPAVGSSVHLRKGRVGDWVNYFTPKAAELFDRACGDVLIEMGYERDHSWVESVGQVPAAAVAT